MRNRYFIYYIISSSLNTGGTLVQAQPEAAGPAAALRGVPDPVRGHTRRWRAVARCRQAARDCHPQGGRGRPGHVHRGAAPSAIIRRLTCEGNDCPRFFVSVYQPIPTNHPSIVFCNYARSKERRT